MTSGCGGGSLSTGGRNQTLGVPCTAATLSSPSITVSDNDGIISVYDLSGARLAALAGPATLIGYPFGVAYGPDGLLYVVNNDPPAVLVFAAGASGDCAPLRVLRGPSTGLGTTWTPGSAAPLNAGIAFDAAHNLYVGSTHDSSILEFAPGAAGDTPPNRTLAGSATLLSGPRQIWIDGAGRLWVANRPANRVSVYASGASGNTAPAFTLEGPHTNIVAPWGVALDSAGYIWVANAAPDNRIVVFDAGSAGDATPTAIITGPPGLLNNPYGEAFDAAGDLWIADQLHSTVDKFSKTATGTAAPLIEFHSGFSPNFVAIRP